MLPTCDYARNSGKNLLIDDGCDDECVLMCVSVHYHSREFNERQARAQRRILNTIKAQVEIDAIISHLTNTAVQLARAHYVCVNI